MNLLKIMMLALVATLTMPVIAQEKTTTADSTMEILRQKLKADKKLVIAANMGLTDVEAKAFWPIYDAYQKDLRVINDRLANAIGAYAEAFRGGPVSNETARQLLDESFAIETAEVTLKQSYVPKLQKALSDSKVARYIQLENKIRALLKYELADNIPLVQ